MNDSISVWRVLEISEISEKIDKRISYQFNQYQALLGDDLGNINENNYSALVSALLLGFLNEYCNTFEISDEEKAAGIRKYAGKKDGENNWSDSCFIAEQVYPDLVWSAEKAARNCRKENTIDRETYEFSWLFGIMSDSTPFAGD